MSENTPKEPPLQNMDMWMSNPNMWMYGMHPSYNGYHGGMYPPFYNNQYYNTMPPNGGFHNNDHHQGNFVHPNISKPPPPAPLLGMSPFDTNRPFYSQPPIRFNLNNNRKSAPIPPNENPLLVNNNAKKKRKKANKSNDEAETDVLPPLPDHPPPLPPCPPPDLPPPPPLDVPLPPPLATEDIPEPLEEQIHVDNKEQELNKNEQQENSIFLPSSTICPTANGTWPESLERYIKRCYEKCRTTFDRDQIDICLKGRITAAANKDEIWTRNWDEEPIPSVHSERNNLSVKPVKGSLSLYQKSESLSDSKPKSGPTSRGYSAHKSPQQRRRRHSRSRSKSKSPKKHMSTSSPSSDEFEDKKILKNKNRQKVKDRLSLDQKKPNKYNKNGKKKNFNQFVVEHVQVNAEKLQKRAERFANTNIPSVASSIQINNCKMDPSPRRLFIQDTEGDYELNNVHIVGTCSDIEKSFLRLTKAPEACEVRPVSVLRSSLKNVKEKWIERQDYRYACDQLKSIRQDLTVQGVRDGFTVEVYETHARIALERGDHEEFNQCQTQLKMLYTELPDCRSNAAEFTAYRILYYVFTKNTLDLTTIFQFLTKEDRENECIKHALLTRCAWATGNLHKFFLLYKTAPLMAGYLMDWFVERERKQYLKYIIKSYRQSVPVDFIVRELAFESTSKALKFLNKFSLIYTGSNQTELDCKASLPAIASI
ncbi:PREDICTED: leukocyte receptor cluster member 8 homolog [Papilio xuthus]|uniref:Leukocyte receptor cluster member 8 homolog n=1 Tax=Papilio xuthus TaxID=66420 RepID=A0A194PVK7_PAPXU|nr:PREDICTED: leukocyte receptor cluster member 8 homolog [Papilio xuthus]KPI97357.1 Leukocyte receptor cluster member 8-like [Papilio xuthus]